jgi:hypothetical protein
LINGIYLTILGICFISSLIQFRQHKPDLKIYSILLGITVLTEILANVAVGPLKWKSNHPFYNSFMLPEYCLYALYFKAIIRNELVRKGISVFLYSLPVVWVFTTVVVLHGLRPWNSYMILYGDAGTVAMCSIYLFEVFKSDEVVDLRTSPEFWIAAGTLMFACCEIPYTGRLNFMVIRDQSAAAWLNITMQILNILLYLTIIYAYQCRRLTTIITKYWPTASRG